MTDELKPAAELAELYKPLPGEQAGYTAARKGVLAKEIEARRALTDLAEARQALPEGPVVKRDYRFIDADGRDLSLADLFGDKDTLFVYFWMYGPERERPCPMCTNFLGGVEGNATDIKQRVALKVLGRSPVSRQMAFAAERGWTDLDFVQTVGHDFAADHDALNDDGTENPVIAVFQKDGDKVRYFFVEQMPIEAADPGQDPRGAVDIAPLWNILDYTPQGRGKEWYPKLSYGEAKA